ncbi:competence protein CoiA [Salsuginibacillus kocurii]|uniref:competence protein CoiA n=1 Tax=Salsuginibacillus kocurii TaxID=427078 RepID=UPI00035F991E|nr:competence protein CoiA family protein [Salsuginibacillus kocurii]
MFIAITKNKQYVNALDEPLLTESLYCPACEHPVHLKKGAIIRPHFAHNKSSLCLIQGEPETKEHMEGKIKLYKWVKNHGYEVSLEKYLPTIQRQPDIFLLTSQGKVAIEFQCSTLPAQDLTERTLDYLKQDIYPVWIFSHHHYPRRPSTSFVSIGSFAWSALRQTDVQALPHLYYFNPSSELFFNLHVSYPLSKNKAFSKSITIPMNKLTVSGLLQPSPLFPTFPFIDWLRHRKNIRFGRNNLRDQPFELQQLFASYKRSFPYFPPEVGWPLQSAFPILTSSYIWQSLLLFKLIERFTPGTDFYVEHVVEMIKQFVQMETIKVRSLPMVSFCFNQLCHEYLHVLKTFGLVTISGRKISWKKALRLPESLEEGFQRDQQLAVMYKKQVNFIPKSKEFM